MALDGDVGARHLIGRYPEAVTEVPLTDNAALIDVDTPEALEQGARRSSKAPDARQSRPAGVGPYLRLNDFGL